MSQLGGLTTNVRDALTWIDVANPANPNTWFRPNQPRIGLYDSASDTGQVALASGVMTSVRIKLFAGDVVTNISFRSGATAATPTNYWFALYSAAATPALLSQTADQGAAAWALNATKTLPLAAAQTIGTTGFYWVGIMVNGTPPTLLGSLAVPPIVTGEANMSQSSGSALTTTAPATIATPTVKTFAPYVVLT